MLSIGYGIQKFCMRHYDMNFEELFEASWLDNARNLQILHDIDNAELCPTGLRDIDDHERLFSIFDISTGSKALMIANMCDGIVFWGTIFGDNCTSILLDICQEKDISIYLNHMLHFPEDKFHAKSLVTGREYESYREYIWEALREVPFANQFID